ncbi:hypothetical protein ACEPAF_1129 [Sanghuangporus sanghuang]
MEVDEHRAPASTSAVYSAVMRSVPQAGLNSRDATITSNNSVSVPLPNASVPEGNAPASAALRGEAGPTSTDVRERVASSAAPGDEIDPPATTGTTGSEKTRDASNNEDNAPQNQTSQFTFSMARDTVPPQVRFSIPAIIPMSCQVEDSTTFRPKKYFRSIGGRTGLTAIGDDRIVMDKRQVSEEQDRARVLEKELQKTQRQLQQAKRQLLEREEIRARGLEAQVTRTQQLLADFRFEGVQRSEGHFSNVKSPDNNWLTGLEGIPMKTPRKKTKEYKTLCAFVRYAFQHKFPKTPKETDFERHIPADVDDVNKYEVGEHTGPVTDDLHIDALSGRSSEWNRRIIDILYQCILDKLNVDKLADDQEQMFRSLVCKKLLRVKVHCRASVQRPMIDGKFESEEEAIARRDAQKKQKSKQDRHNMRRHTIFDQRIKTCKTKLMVLPEPDRDVSPWNFLYNVLMAYGVEGMSSDESEDSSVGARRTIYHVKVLAWRKDIDKYLDFIDAHHIYIVSKRGTPGRTDRRRDHTFASDRGAKPELPRSFYDEMWLDGPAPKQAMIKMTVSKKNFEWLRIFDTQTE